MRDGDRLELVHVSNNDKQATSIYLNIRYSEISQVNKMREPDACEVAKGVDAGEGVEREGEIRREVDRSNGTVSEGEVLESGERFESCEGERDVVSAVGEVEGKEVAERGGVVTSGGGLKARVFGGWEV